VGLFFETELYIILEVIEFEWPAWFWERLLGDSTTVDAEDLEIELLETWTTENDETWDTSGVEFFVVTCVDGVVLFGLGSNVVVLTELVDLVTRGSVFSCCVVGLFVVVKALGLLFVWELAKLELIWVVVTSGVDTVVDILVILAIVRGLV
jgi:hypothetical protein